MLFLLLAILFGSMFSVAFKLCQNHRIDAAQVILFNYITGIVVSAASVIISIADGECIGLEGCIINSKSAFLPLIQGFFFFLGFRIMDSSTRCNGVALTTASARASLVLPVVLGYLLLSQKQPDWLEVGLVIVAMLLTVLPAESQNHKPARMTGISGEPGRKKAVLLLCAVFLTYGISDFSLKIVQHSVQTPLQSPRAQELLLSFQTVLIFCSAMLFSLIHCIVSGSFRKHPFGWKAVLGGVALGLLNTGCTTCILRALSVISTSVFYPVYNIGIVVIATLVGLMVFGEKLKPVQIAGLVIAVGAIALQLLGLQ